MQSENAFVTGVAATVSVISICITTYYVLQDERLAALDTCINERMESAARIDCARAIYGTADVEIAQ